jgi:hypothetical protein
MRRCWTIVCGVLTCSVLNKPSAMRGPGGDEPRSAAFSSSLAEIRTDGTPPMVVRAELQGLGPKGELVPGNYTCRGFHRSDGGKKFVFRIIPDCGSATRRDIGRQAD